jgi:hypothetical protein
MDETLKALQLAERALLALVGALLVFVISIDRTNGPYEAALAEYSTLQKVMGLVRQANTDDEQAAYASSKLVKIVSEVAQKLGIDAGNVKYYAALSNEQMDSIPPMYLADSEQKLDDYYRYIKRAKFGGTHVFEFDEEELRQELEKLFSFAGSKLSEIYLGPARDEKYKEIPNQCHVEITVNTGKEVKETSPVKCQRVAWAPNQKAIKILADHQLFVENDGYIFPLPAESKVWDDLAGKEIQTAVGILERKSAAEISARKGNATALGMTLNPKIVGIVGPGLELALLLYLLALANQLLSVREADLDKVVNFPEIAILRTSVGELLVLASILLFPICTTIMLITVSFQEMRLRYGFMALFSVLWLVLSTQLLTRLWRVARMLKPMPVVEK